MKPRSKALAILLGLLCIALAVFMTVEASHSHVGVAASGHCSLCASAHLAIHTEPAWLTPLILLLLGTVFFGEALPGSRPLLLTSCIRPPPSASR